MAQSPDTLLYSIAYPPLYTDIMAVMRQCEKPSKALKHVNLMTYLQAEVDYTDPSPSLPPVHKEMFTFANNAANFPQILTAITVRTPSQTIVLVGLMGSGKTALGKRLAVALDRPFIDGDQLIEHEAGLSVRDIFELSGEAKFREIERNTILKRATGEPVILSTGGNAFCDPRTRAEIIEHAISIWTDSTPKNLLRRIGNFASTSPADNRRSIGNSDQAARDPSGRLQTSRTACENKADIHGGYR